MSGADLMAAARRLEALLGGAVFLAQETERGSGPSLAEDALLPLLETLHRDAIALAEALDLHEPEFLIEEPER